MNPVAALMFVAAALAVAVQVHEQDREQHDEDRDLERVEALRLVAEHRARERRGGAPEDRGQLRAHD